MMLYCFDFCISYWTPPPLMYLHIAALGNNQNQLAHIANASGKVSNTDLLTAKQIMEQIWRYIKGGGVQ